MFLFSFIAFACSKEDGDMGPSASVTKASTTHEDCNANFISFGEYINPRGENLGLRGYCLSDAVDEGNGIWSFTIKQIGPSQGIGLSNLVIGAVYCPEEDYSGKGKIDENNVEIRNGESAYTPPVEYSVGTGTGCIIEDDVDSFFKLDELNELTTGKEYTVRFTYQDEFDIDYFIISVKAGNNCKNIEIDAGDCKPKYDCNLCAYSQGRYFNKGNKGKHWPDGVYKIYVGKEELTSNGPYLPATTPERRALFQAGALILSAKEQGIDVKDYIKCLPENVKDAFYCIVKFYKDKTKPASCDLQVAASTIGNWIDKKHCKDEDYKK